MDAYISNNPQYAEAFTNNRTGNQRIFPLISGSLIGVVTGLVLYRKTWAFKKLF